MSQSRFDHAAATWDEQPARVMLAQEIVATLLRQVPVQPTMTAFDFGCGTGLVTLALAPHVRRIIGVDSSPGMLAKLREKVAGMGNENVEAQLLDLTTQPPPEWRVDLLVSAMVLHHVEDVAALLRTLAGLLNPGGYLALADLDAEDGTFHPDPTGVYHHGIDRDWLRGQLAELGLGDVKATTAHVILRPPTVGPPQRYPVFLVSGKKRD